MHMPRSRQGSQTLSGARMRVRCSSARALVQTSCTEAHATLPKSGRSPKQGTASPLASIVSVFMPAPQFVGFASGSLPRRPRAPTLLFERMRSSRKKSSSFSGGREVTEVLASPSAFGKTVGLNE